METSVANTLGSLSVNNAIVCYLFILPVHFVGYVGEQDIKLSLSTFLSLTYIETNIILHFVINLYIICKIIFIKFPLKVTINGTLTVGIKLIK